MSVECFPEWSNAWLSVTPNKVPEGFSFPPGYSGTQSSQRPWHFLSHPTPDLLLVFTPAQWDCLGWLQADNPKSKQVWKSLNIEQNQFPHEGKAESLLHRLYFIGLSEGTVLDLIANNTLSSLAGKWHFAFLSNISIPALFTDLLHWFSWDTFLVFYRCRLLFFTRIACFANCSSFLQLFLMGRSFSL